MPLMLLHEQPAESNNNGTMNPFSVVPGFNIFKYSLAGSIEIIVFMMIDLFLL